MATLNTQETKKRPQKRKANHYAQIHRNALPIAVFPLPVFHPTQPLSLVQLLWTVLRQWVRPPSSRLAQKYTGYLSEKTHSIHITDPQHVRALWEQGFFGKGSLSRSEPTWIEREKTRIVARNQGSTTAEEATKARREERRLFKLERARLERERIDTQRKLEQGEAVEQSEPSLVASVDQGGEPDTEAAAALSPSNEPVSDRPYTVDIVTQASTKPSAGDALDAQVLDTPAIMEEEHLQLTFEEAFFLSFGLGVLDIRSTPSPNSADLSTDSKGLFATLQRLSKPQDASLPAMDDRFILNYVVYHHFRSLGWVVRPGVKFSVDYLLYNRGPVFSHAEFAILIMPSYSDAYWHTTEGQALRKQNDQRDWWWLHCINRVQSQVKKTLVLCYVDIPPPQEGVLEQEGVSAFLKRYHVREFIVRRWLMNRSRD